MNPQQPSNQANASINLPPPTPTVAPTAPVEYALPPAAEAPVAAPIAPAEYPQSSPETGGIAPATSAPVDQAAPSVQGQIPAPVPVIPVVNVASSTTQSVVPSVLEDKDLIEKEWVNKAKAIVERNRDDPYKQSEELTEVRAEYLQKNYNKTIKSGK